MSTDIHTLAGAYALDAVSDIERAEFGRHVASCESCAQELAELHATVGRLADATAAPVPAQLKASVLETVARTRQLPPARTRDVRSARARRGWRGWAAAAAAVVVIGAGGGVAGYAISTDRLHDAQRTATTAQRAAAAARSEKAQIDGVLSAGDARVKVEPVSGGGLVTVVTSATRNQGVAVLSNMPALPGNDVYQLWVMHGTRPAISEGVMDPGVLSGTQVLTDVRGATAFAISHEKNGGAQAPSTPAVLSVSI